MSRGRRRVLVALVAVALTVLLALLIALPPFDGEAGRVVVAFDDDHRHGLHLADLPAIGCWVVGMLACAGLWRSRT